jgi:hypothetical protein
MASAVSSLLPRATSNYGLVDGRSEDIIETDAVSADEGGHEGSFLSSAGVGCCQFMFYVYYSLSIFSVTSEKTALSGDFSEVQMKELAVMLGDQRFNKAADMVLCIKKNEETALIVDDSNIAANTFRSFVIVKTVKPEPYGRFAVSWVQHDLHLNMCIVFFTAALGVFACFLVGWEWGSLCVVVKICADLIVSRTDSSHACAVALVKEFCVVDANDKVRIILTPRMQTI